MRQFRQQRRTFYATYVALILLGLIILQIMQSFGPPFGAALMLLMVVVGVAMVRPALGLGLCIVLAIVGDERAMPWWPLVKNFSSGESVLFLSDGLTFSPVDVLLGTVAVVWLIGRLLTVNPRPIEYGPFWRPLLVFSISLAFGLAWGKIGRDGFNPRVAFFEVRPLLYIPLVYLLATNLFSSLRHYHRLYWGILVALTVESVHGLVRLDVITDGGLLHISPVEHTAALHMNLVILALLTTWWFGTTKIGKRALLSTLAIPVVLLYLSAERRSAVVGLIIGCVFIWIVLLARNRQKFFRVVPVVVLLGAGYLALFWNAEGNQAGFPAQAVKIIVQPESATEKDTTSNDYRELENFDLWYTVRSSPITGIGFGQKFPRPLPLPDISGFVFWEYIPHNSLLWLWTQVGIVGFLAFMYVFALGIATGVRAATRMRVPDDATLLGSVAAFIPMLFAVAFVEISFDPQTTLLLAASLALVGSAERLSGLADLDSVPTAADEPLVTRANLALDQVRETSPAGGR